RAIELKSWHGKPFVLCADPRTDTHTTFRIYTSIAVQPDDGGSASVTPGLADETLRSEEDNQENSSRKLSPRSFFAGLLVGHNSFSLSWSASFTATAKNRSFFAVSPSRHKSTARR